MAAAENLSFKVIQKSSKMKSKNIRKFARVVLIILSCLVIMFSLASLVYDIPRWYLKILDFPRLQLLTVGIFLFLSFLLITKEWKFSSIALVSGLLASIFIQFEIISPYLLKDTVVKTVKASEVTNKNSVDILIANVLIKNRKTQTLKEIITTKEPDIILLMEVDSWWVDNFSYLKKTHPYTIEYPLDNAYGMALYSKLPISNHQIKFLNHSKVPSFFTKVTLASGKEFKFVGVHPVAPFPSDKYPENIGEQGKDQQKEVELLRVGDIASKYTLPTIIAGDFNDVAWSNTSRLFGKDGNLKDVRIGRGLYNTFNAESLIMRWPLDHFFVTEDITVQDFNTLSKIGSDHFPLYAKFVIE
ncbi:endonuclease/exonuclease/phosphatase family protein [Gillisia sp. Hel_I_29]|uniref:endonuclease/exonuclease/phosphatase family protein n=1 Tax=Gillisia sp. Hel_I_29 TaxID=1249975 RepID=UPI000B0E5E8E|nr:endonuclease/exonuclease/phosphatase family protein [Gillisia sp. Hel_I_29]